MVTDSLSATDGSGRSNRSAPVKSYSEQVHEHFPYYLAIGMTYELYWEGDPQLVKDYRKADELRRQRVNEDQWWQGMYIYNALCCVAPIFRDLAKKGTKAHPYPDTPYAINKKQKEIQEETKERKNAEAGKRYMEGFMAKFNTRFEKS